MKTQKGFTLIELLVVISIIGLLSSVVLASLNSARDKGKLAAAKQFAHGINNVLGSEMLGAWTFDEGSGSTVYDVGYSGNNGTLVNSPTWITDGPFNGALKLSTASGQHKMVTIPSTSRVNKGTGALTVSAWVRMNSVSSIMIITNRGDNNNAVPWAQFWYNGSTNQLVMRNGDNTFPASKTISIEDGKWHNVTMSASAGNPVKFFLDGADVTGTTYNFIETTYTSQINAAPFEIGARTQGGTLMEDFVGDIDDVRIYSQSYDYLK